MKEKLNLLFSSNYTVPRDVEEDEKEEGDESSISGMESQGKGTKSGSMQSFIQILSVPDDDHDDGESFREDDDGDGEFPILGEEGAPQTSSTRRPLPFSFLAQEEEGEEGEEGEGREEEDFELLGEKSNDSPEKQEVVEQTRNKEGKKGNEEEELERQIRLILQDDSQTQPLILKNVHFEEEEELEEEEDDEAETEAEAETELEGEGSFALLGEEIRAEEEDEEEDEDDDED